MSDKKEIKFNPQRMQEIEKVSALLRAMICEGLEEEDIPQALNFEFIFPQSYTDPDCAVAVSFLMSKVPKASIESADLQVAQEIYAARKKAREDKAREESKELVGDLPLFTEGEPDAEH